MPYVDLPSRNLSVSFLPGRLGARELSDPSLPPRRRQYYTINPSYEPNAEPSIKARPPAAREAIDDAKPILVFCHAATSSSHSFLCQVRARSLR